VLWRAETVVPDGTPRPRPGSWQHMRGQSCRREAKFRRSVAGTAVLRGTTNGVPFRAANQFTERQCPEQ